MGHLAGCFGRVEPRRQARKYVAGLLSDLPRKNCWTLAEHVGDRTPDRMQRLLERASWNALAAMRVVRDFVVTGLGGADAVLVLDESGQEKKGEATAGVKRQYVGCAGQVANALNVVYASYATPRGHALVGARLYLPAEWVAHAGRRRAAGVPDSVGFATKPALAVQLINELADDDALPPWLTGDEVYGRDPGLRGCCEARGVGYVLGIPCPFRVTLPCRRSVRADRAAALAPARAWTTVSCGAGSKGDRDYAWAWLATASDRHHLLIRRNLNDPRDLAFFYCHVPAGRPVTLTILVRVAGRRWPVEEDFQVGKSHLGLADSQVRSYTALHRHLALAMAAEATCAVTAADARTRAAALPPAPTRPDDEPPAEPGLIPFTVAEVKRLFGLLTRTWHTTRHHLHWSRWRRRHQARARWFHHRARLRRQAAPP
ncbi:MAG: IS701 family transposase [Streptosporangiales bacterium]